MALIKLTEDNFNAEVMESSEPVLIDFWASWCGPCKMLSPVVEQIAEEVEDFKVASCNVDDEMELAAKYGVQSIPTLIVIKGGEEAGRSVGVVPKDRILSLVRG